MFYIIFRVVSGIGVFSSGRLMREGVGKCKKIGVRVVISIDMRDDISEFFDVSGRVEVVRDVGDGNGFSVCKR